jgi:hypothetical protein
LSRRVSCGLPVTGWIVSIQPCVPLPSVISLLTSRSVVLALIAVGFTHNSTPNADVPEKS